MRLLGVIGTMVWDTILRESDGDLPVEEWGGISYALAAADAVRPAKFRVRPVIKLGRDLAERGLRFLSELTVIESDRGVAVVDEINPRVELRYTAAGRRCERLQGGVPAWTWEELATRIEDCDALYVNFITGSEFTLPVAQQLRRSFRGPIYADIHSLTLATGPRGERRLQPLSRWSEWLACFDAVQLNGEELASLSRGWGDPWAFAADVVGGETRLLFVTLGARGAAYVVTADSPPLEVQRVEELEVRGRVRTGRVPVTPVAGGDPTGCGDVWGITVFQALLDGCDVEEAMALANAAAQANVSHRGASGLSRFLRGEIERG